MSTPFYKSGSRQIVFTDLEPDDSLAISIMNQDNVVYWVVGEGRQLPQKATRLIELVKASCKVYLGAESDKEFEETHEATLGLKPFDIPLLEDVDTVVMMKPPREFMKYLRYLGKRIKELTLVYYGSFNTRCLFDEYERDDVIGFLSSFKNTYIYESYYAVGQENLITEHDVITRVRQLPHMAEIMDNWDASIVEDCRATCASIDPLFPESIPEDHEDFYKYERNRKCYDSIVKAGIGQQMVFADIGLMLSAPSNYTDVNIEFTLGGYLRAVLAHGSPVHVVNHLGKREMLRRLRHALCKD